MKRYNVSVVVYLVLVFLSGVLVGSVGYGLYNARSVSAKTNPCSPDAVRRRYVDEMQTRLNLRSDQVQKLYAILDGTHHQFKALREKYRPELKAIQAQQTDSVRAILDDKQRAEYERMRQEREKQAKQPKTS